MKKQNIIIILIVLFILTLLLGYSIFRVNSDVETKMTYAKTLEVDFIRIGKIEEVGSSGARAYIHPHRKYVTIEVPNLQYKGAYAKVPITIKNVGLIPAKLKWIDEYGINTNRAINVTYSGIGVTDRVLFPGETSNVFVTVKWDKDIRNIYDNDLYFRISLYYEQG